MRGKALVMCVLVLVAIAQSQTAKSARKPSTLPFDSFRSLDEKLSLLDVQLNRIEALVQKAASGTIATSSGKGGRQSWNGASRQMLANVRMLEKTAVTLQRHYKRSVAGKSLFPGLLTTAGALDTAATALAASKNIAQAKSALERARQARIDFVLSFHALSADHGALRCERGRWACCEVGRQNGTAACRWSCVQSPRHCSKGLLGPQSQSASADVVRH